MLPLITDTSWILYASLTATLASLAFMLWHVQKSAHLAATVAATLFLIAGMTGIIRALTSGSLPADQHVQPVQAACPAHEAHYHHTASGFTADFARFNGSANSPYYLHLKSPLAHDYWFRFSSSNGYGGLSLIPIHNPLEADAIDGPQDIHIADADQQALNEALPYLRYYPLNEADEILSDALPNGLAPTHFLLPEIGQLLWYDPGLLNGLANTPAEVMPRGFFRLDRCNTTSS